MKAATSKSSLFGHSGVVERLLRWWMAELASMLPTRLRRWIGGGRGQWTIAFDEEKISLLRETGGIESVVAQVSRELPSAEAGKRLGTAFRKAGGGVALRRGWRGQRMRLRLPAAEALKTQVVLPKAAEENLEEVLRFELDRWTPFRPQDVHIAHRVEERDAGAGTLKVSLTLVQRSAAQAALVAMTKLGPTVDSVEVENAEGGHELLFRPKKDGPSRPVRLVLRTAAAAGALALTAVTGVAAYDQVAKIDRLRAEIDQRKLVVDEAQRLKAKIAQLEGEQGMLAERSNGFVSVNEVLYQLTTLLPDDTWLSRLRLSPDKIVLSCFSGSSSTVIRLMENSRLFRSPSLSSQVVHDSAKNRDQFELTASIGGGSR
jgi:general secretion pathway protein L